MSNFSPSIIFYLAAAILFFVFWAARRYNRNRMAVLAEVLDERSGEARGWFSFTLAGHFNGREAEFRLTPGSKNSPPKLHTRLKCAAPMVFSVSREGVGARFAKALHLMKDVDVGDPVLDERYVFSTQDPEIFAEWVKEPEVKEAIMSLMDLRNMDRLDLKDGQLQALRVRFDKEDLQPPHARAVLERLDALARTFEVGK